MSQDSDVEIIGETTNMIPKSKSSDDDDVMIIEDMSTDQSDMSSEDRLSLAEQKKDEGNLAYTAKKYRQALELYCQAIELCPDVASYYNNRSACYLMLGQYEKALAEAQASVARNPAYFKGQMRVARCCLSLGDTAGAETALTHAQTLQPELASGGAAASNQLQSEWHNWRTLKRLLANVQEAESAGGAPDWRRVLFLLELALKAAPAGGELRARRCHALVRLDRLEEAQLQVQQLLRSDVNNAEAFYVRGLCLYCSGVDDDVRRACLAFQHVLRLAPDHQRAKTAYKRAKELRTKKEQATTAFREGRLAEALSLYQQLLQLDSDNRRVNSKLHFNVATVLAKQNQPALSLDHCSQAIELSPNYIKAYLRRAKCYMELEQFEEAVRDYEKVFSMERTHEHRQLLSTAKLELKKSKRKDFYKILGVGKQATDDEIKKAYRKQALSHHPDRHSSAGTEERRVQEHKFKEVGEAYGVLSNKEKRRRYDNGQDLDEINGGSAGGADINVNDMFQQFFGSSAAGAAAGGPGPGMRFSSRMGQENFQFPGGSSFQFTFG